MSIKIHTFWNIAGSAVPLVVAAVAVPYLVNSLGIESFGVLTLIWTLIGYFSLFDLGLGRAITHHISSKLDVIPMPEIINRINVGLICTLAAGLLGATVIFILAEPATGWMKVSKAIQHQTYQAFVFSALAIPFVALSSGMRGILEAFDHFGQVNLVRITQGTTTFVLPVVSLYIHGSDLGMIALYLGLSRLIVLMCYLVSVKRLVGKHWHFNTDKLTFDTSLLKFGGWMTVSNIISPMLVYFDRFIISSVIGSQTVAYYTVPFEIATRLLIIPGAMGSALFPKLASRYHHPSKTVGHLIKHSMAAMMLIMALLCLVVYATYEPIMTWWISKEFADASKDVVSLLIIGVWMNSLGFIAYTALQAKTGAKQTAILHLTELFLFIPMLFLLLIEMGITGAALAWTIRVSFDALAMFWLLKRSR